MKRMISDKIKDIFSDIVLFSSMALAGYVLFMAIKIILIDTLPLSFIDNQEIVLNKTLPIDNLNERQIRTNISFENKNIFTKIISSFMLYRHDIDIDFGNLEEKFIELDNNKTTYDLLIFEGDINPSIKSFHNVWIIQYEKGKKGKIIFHDTNCTFPITINIDKNEKWATIDSEHKNGVIKHWVFDDGSYRERE